MCFLVYVSKKLMTCVRSFPPVFSRKSTPAAPDDLFVSYIHLKDSVLVSSRDLQSCRWLLFDRKKRDEDRRRRREKEREREYEKAAQERARNKMAAEKRLAADDNLRHSGGDSDTVAPKSYQVRSCTYIYNIERSTIIGFS